FFETHYPEHTLVLTGSSAFCKCWDSSFWFYTGCRRNLFATAKHRTRSALAEESYASLFLPSIFHERDPVGSFARSRRDLRGPERQRYAGHERYQHRFQEEGQ